MDYKKIYNNLIEKARIENRKKLKRNNVNYVYYERHHILPKCLGGSNDKENLVLLTAREHFVCHKLLVLIYPNHKGVFFALHNMMFTKSNKNTDRHYNISSKEYCKARELFSFYNSGVTHPMYGKRGKLNKLYGVPKSEKHKENMRKNHADFSGEKHPMYGKNHTKESKNKIANRHYPTGKDNPTYGRKLSKESRKNISVKAKERLKDKRNHPMYGKKKTKEERIEMSKRMKGRFKGKNNPNYGKNHSDEIKNKIKESWKNREITFCPYCDKSSINKSMMVRWHFDNCKFKIND